MARDTTDQTPLSSVQDLTDYIAAIGDPDKVVNMLVGDTQRIWVYAEQGFAVHQDIPANVMNAFGRLIAAGFTRRLIEPRKSD